MGVPPGGGGRPSARGQRAVAVALPSCPVRGAAGDGRALRQTFASPAPLLAGAAEAGDPLAVLPALFHLLWQWELTADLGGGPLWPSTEVRVAEAAR